jgi:lipopolysaccharide export system protein LptA
MRRPLLIIGSALVLAALFVAYWWTQTPAIRLVPENDPAHAPGQLVPNESGKVIGPGQGLWVSQYNDDLRLVSQFRASELIPQPDNTVEAKFPEARIPMASGSVIHLLADKGVMQLREMHTAAKGPLGDSVPQMPSRGKLQHVTIYIEDAAGQRQLTMHVNNAAFDMDTFRVYTDAYTDTNGQTIPADRVKVEVRGQQADFDGYGLTLRWDGQNQIIQLLEIAHGERAVMKKAPALKETPKAASQPVAAAPVGPTTPTDNPTPTADVTSVSPATPASIGPATATAASSAPASQKSVPKITTYRATLQDNLRIVQNDQTLATGDLLTIDFLSESGGSASEKLSPATTATAAQPSGPSPASAPAGAPQAAPSSVSSSTETAAAPATGPQTSPITLYWTGPLRIVPLTTPPLAPLARGQAVAELSGRAVAIQYAGANVVAGSVLYRTASHQADDFTAVLRPAPGHPTLTLVDADHRTLTTEAITYNGATQTATLQGQGELKSPATDKGEPLTAAWSRGATVLLAGDGKEQSLRNIECTGDIHVQSPRVTFTSGVLRLHFEPGKNANSPLLRQITASESVKAVSMNDGQPMTLESDYLLVQMKDDSKGGVFADQMTATGHAHAYDPAQHLYADSLTATFAPPAKDSAAVSTATPEAASGTLKEVVAEGHVKFIGKDNVTATGDRLHLTMVNKVAQVDLSGNAQIISEQGELTGPLIHFSGDTGTASVKGAGSLKATQTTDAGKQKISVAWSQLALMNAEKNTIDVLGKVKMASVSDDGVTNNATSDSAHITLATVAPATQSTAPAPRPAATKPANSFADLAGTGFGNKEPVAVMLKGNVEVGHTEQAGNALARRMYLLSSEVDYDLKTKKMTVPAQGRILYEDLRPADAADRSTGPRGATAIAWTKSFVVDQQANKAIVDGGVVIKHLPTTGDVTEGSATSIVINLAPAATTAKSDTTPPMAITSAIAQGPVTFTSAGRTFKGNKLTYDAKTHIVTATGADQDPIRVLDDKGALSGRASEVRVDLQTGKLLSMKDFIAEMRR